MITAVFKADPDKLRLSCEVRGHANTAPEGHDLICAAATAYLTQMAQVVEYACAEGGKVDGKPRIILHKGVGEVACTAAPGGYAEILHTFYCGEVGFFLLARSHPDAVRLIPFSVSSDEEQK